MIVPPLSASQGLTHEQVLPFLKKLENGQEREGMYIYIYMCYLNSICDPFWENLPKRSET